MALNPTTLGSALAALLITDTQATGPAAPAAWTAIANDIATAVVAHIIANAVVSPLTAGVPTLLSAAPGAPVTGTGTIL